MEAAIVPTTEQTAIALQQKRHSLTLWLSLMVGLAEARQASVSEETQKLYVKHLQEFPIEVVKEAVKRIALEPRRDGETAFPPLAVIHARSRAVRAEFKRREMVAEEKQRDEEEFLKCVSEWMEDFGWSVAEIASRFPSRARLLRERWQA